ncbi:MAG: hypothetical protein EHM64_16725 [Ignavibacteriae bacterium]|nr:MAG: hypothetical protein EHM64_16725 [Ignavibacteriota bacterium]
MNSLLNNKRLIAILWFIAAGLALLAGGIRFLSDGEFSLFLVAAAVFCVVMGVSTMRRKTAEPPINK